MSLPWAVAFDFLSCNDFLSQGNVSWIFQSLATEYSADERFKLFDNVKHLLVKAHLIFGMASGGFFTVDDSFAALR